MAGQRTAIADAKMYYGTAGSTASTLLDTVGDVTYGAKKAEAVMQSRASRFKMSKATLVEIDIDFTIDDVAGDTKLAALITAYQAHTPLAFLVKDATDGTGIDADFELIGMNREEKLDGGIQYKFAIKPTYVSRYPAFV